MLVLSAAYFPPVGYFQLMFRHQDCLLDVCEFYGKQTYRNRCSILSANGVLDLVVPVRKVHGTKMQIKDVCIAYDENWQENHQRSLMSAYRNSPYYAYIIEDFTSVWAHREKYLLDLNLKIDQLLRDYVPGLPPMPLSDHYVQACDDYRFYKSSELGFNRLTQHTTRAKQTVPKYQQVFYEKFGFVANLSILDLLFNLGPDTPDYLQGKMT